MTFSPGLIVFGQFLPHQFLQIGVYTDFEKYRVLQDSETIIEGSNRLSFSTGYRYSLHRFWASSLSLVSSYSMGNTRSLQGNRDIATTTASDAASHGAELSIQYLPNGLNHIQPSIEVIYSHFFTENSNEQADHLGVFISFVFLFQEGLTNQQREKLRQGYKKR